MVGVSSRGRLMAPLFVGGSGLPPERLNVLLPKADASEYCSDARAETRSEERGAPAIELISRRFSVALLLSQSPSLLWSMLI